MDITVDDADTDAVVMAETPGWRNLKNVTDDELAALVETDAEDDPATEQGEEV